MIYNQRKSLVLMLTVLFTLFITVNTALAAAYIGSLQSNKYHYTDCRWAKKIRAENAVYFNSREEAANAGYVPCGTCRP